MIQANIMDSPTTRYDIIVGRGILDKYKFIVDFDAKLIHWGDLSTSMRQHDHLHHPVPTDGPLEPEDPAVDTFYTKIDGKIISSKV
jgi:hypothetical protein